MIDEPCHHCDAVPGEPCRTPRGYPLPIFHSARRSSTVGPSGIRIPIQPLGARPDAPAPGEHVHVLWYRVEHRAGRENGRPRFFVYDGQRPVAMALHWDRLCHVLNWYPLDGLEPGQRIPRTAAKPASKPKPKPAPVVRQVEHEQPELLPLFALEAFE